VVVNGMVYVGSDNGNIDAFSLPRGPEQDGAASRRPDINKLRP